MVTEPRVVQCWSEIILVISNRTRAAHSFNFESMHMILAQIALHSVQLPLFILLCIGLSLIPKDSHLISSYSITLNQTLRS